MIYRDEQKQTYEELKLLYEKEEEYQDILENLKNKCSRWVMKTTNDGFFDFDLSTDAVNCLILHYEFELKEIDKQLEKFKISKRGN